ncbi:MAG: tetratricopeptide repeat-containing glycosyltransferase family protein [Gemmataceae bacterium]|nr:tetratricopeptide repeat-containing glycosyltransferase family protein [Gemmataceae bacterium]
MSTVPEALDLAVQHHRAGDLLQAEQIYQEILQEDPNQVDVLHLLGLIAYQMGQLEQASASMGRALRLRPDFAAAHNNLGIVLKEQGKLTEAAASYQQALRCRPDYAEAHNNLGNVLQRQGQLDEAVACYCQALHFRPNYAEAHTNLGDVLRQQGQLDEAVACYQQALGFRSDFAGAHASLGMALQEQGQFDKAVASYQQALCLKPEDAETRANLGIALQAQGKLDQAVASYQQALRLQPDSVAVHNNLGNALQQQGKLEEALASYQQALRLKPDHADAHWNRALAWLLAGNFEQGFPEYEWRWQRKGIALPPFSQPLWDGSPLAGQTILLYAEQGLGDTLHFIRYAPLVQARGGRVLVACPALLIPLLSRCRGIDRLLPQEGPLPSFDVYAPLLSLPRLFGTTQATVPAQVPYLFTDPALCTHWREQLPGRQAFTIGIAWQGSPNYHGDRQRSIPLVQFAPLAALPGVQLVSLQKGLGTEQLQGVAGQFPVLDLGSQLDKTSGAFAETAAVMQNLDLVITADTAIGHLAGALGVPVWVALPFAPDWRWPLHWEDSPWYPTVRLFRQKEWGHWPEVFARMADAVRQLLVQAACPQPVPRARSSGEPIDPLGTGPLPTPTRSLATSATKAGTCS